MLYLITGVGLILFVAAVAGLILLVRSGQFDDLDTPAHRILGDDPEAPAAPRTAAAAAPRTPPPSRGSLPADPAGFHERAVAAKADR